MAKQKKFARIKKTLLYEDLSTELQSAIIDAQFEPGERLVEAHLAEQFGTSRGPIREALQDLERQGIVTRIPNRGTFLCHWSRKVVQDFYIFRAHVEGLSARLAAERRSHEDIHQLRSVLSAMQKGIAEGNVQLFLNADTGYHLLTAQIADCAPMFSVIEGMRWRTRLLMSWAKVRWGASELFEEALDYHARITAAIDGGDAEGAQNAMREHILGSGERLLAHWAADNPRNPLSSRTNIPGGRASSNERGNGKAG